MDTLKSDIRIRMHPDPITNIAKVIKRDRSSVYRDISQLEQFGLVKIHEAINTGAFLHNSSLRGSFLAGAIENVVKNHYIAYILDWLVEQNAPHNDDACYCLIASQMFFAMY